MLFVTVRNLHDRTAEILRQAEEDAPVFVTRYGRPIAVIRSLAQEDLEDLTMLTDPELRKGLEEGRADVTVGRVSDLDKLITDVEAKL